MSLIAIPNVFSAGTVIVASQHNSNFSTIANAINGGLDNTNLTGSAGITYANLTLTGGIVDGDLANLTITGAKIANTTIDLTTKVTGALPDSNLAQITTASKVHGTSITGLASLPSGAGVIPVANLPTLGAMSLVSTTSFAAGTGDTLDITIDSTKQYFVKVIITSQAAQDVVGIRINADTGNNYQYIYRGWYGGTPTALNASSAITSSIIAATTISSSASYTYVDFYIMPQATSSTKPVNVYGKVSSPLMNNSGNGWTDFNGTWANSATVTSFRMHCGTKVTTGTVYLYEIAIS